MNLKFEDIDEDWRRLVIGCRTYFVSSKGRVWGGRFRRLYKPYVDKDGYQTTTIEAVPWKVHRLVAWAFCGAPPSSKSVVRHLDGNPKNNHTANLAWGTQVENWEDRIKHGRARNGSQHPDAKLTEAQVIQIRSRVDSIVGRRYGYRRPLAREFGVSVEAIQAVVSRKTWRHI